MDALSDGLTMMGSGWPHAAEHHGDGSAEHRAGDHVTPVMPLAAELLSPHDGGGQSERRQQ